MERERERERERGGGVGKQGGREESRAYVCWRVELDPHLTSVACKSFRTDTSPEFVLLAEASATLSAIEAFSISLA